MSDVYLLMRDTENASKCLTRAIELHPSKSLTLKLGKVYIEENKSSEANNLFKKFADSTLDSQVLEQLGFIYLGMKNGPEALYYLGQAIVLNPQSQDVLLSLGALAQEYGDLEGAIHRYQQFYNENQNSAEMWSNLGNCYMEKEIYVSALSCFKRALYLNPLEWSIYYNLGLVYMHMKVYSAAFHFFLSSVKYHSQNADAFSLMGACLNRLDDPANAYNAFDKACKIAPNDHMVYLNFAIFLAEHSKDPTNFELAKEKFSRHNELYSKNKVSIDSQVETQRNNLKKVLGLN